MTGYRDLLRNHDFTVLWIGQTISELGSRMSIFVFPLVTFAITGSALLAASARGGLPARPGRHAAAGRRARRPRRPAPADALRQRDGRAPLRLAGRRRHRRRRSTVPHLLVVALLTGAAAGLFAPAEISAVRSVVPTEELPTALAQNQARQHVAGTARRPARRPPVRRHPVAAVRRRRGDLRRSPGCCSAGSAPTCPLPRARRPTAPQGPPRPGRGLRLHRPRPLFRVLMVWSALTNLVVNALFFVAVLRLIEGGIPAFQIGLVETAAGACGILGAVAAPA